MDQPRLQKERQNCAVVNCAYVSVSVCVCECACFPLLSLSVSPSNHTHTHKPFGSMERRFLARRILTSTMRESCPSISDLDPRCFCWGRQRSRRGWAAQRTARVANASTSQTRAHAHTRTHALRLKQNTQHKQTTKRTHTHPPNPPQRLTPTLVCMRVTVRTTRPRADGSFFAVLRPSSITSMLRWWWLHTSTCIRKDVDNQ